MITPRFLKKGDTVAIVGLAKKIEAAAIQKAQEILESWGLAVITGEHLFHHHFRYSSTDENRARDFQKALDDPSVCAIISARGGYGSMRILDQIDWRNFVENPKWIVGFSDITAVLGHVFNKGVLSIHGIMPSYFHMEEAASSIEELRKVLFGEKQKITFAGSRENFPGKASGLLIGGNLSLLCNIMGSASDFDYTGKILFIEEIDEHLYRIDRMLIQLKRAGKFEKLQGLLVGNFTEIKDNEGDPFGKHVEDIICEHLQSFQIPIAFGLPVGHEPRNLPLIVGQQYHLDVRVSDATIAGD